MTDNLRDAFKAVLENIDGEDADREGLEDTPERVARAWQFWTSGYNQNPINVLKTFVDGAEGVDEMVVVKDLPPIPLRKHRPCSIPRYGNNRLPAQ